MKKLVFLTTALLSLGVNAQTIRYVKQGGNGNGTSWEKASGDIQAMINIAQEGEQIWVAKGTYKPNRRADNPNVQTPNDRNNAFVLKKNVSLYGGFIGTETSLDQRNWKQNETVLSGDFKDNDVVSGSGRTLKITGNLENARHIIISTDDVGNARLDGFTVRGGNATASPNAVIVNNIRIDTNSGGGMFIKKSSPTIENVRFYGNINNDLSYLSSSYGGGIYIENGSPKISNTIFENNGSFVARSSEGGAIHNKNSTPSIVNSIFKGNYAHSTNHQTTESNSFGGAIYNDNSSPIITDVIFENNTTYSANHYPSSPRDTNYSCTSCGGGIYNKNNSAPIITNSIFQNNSSYATSLSPYIATRYTHPSAIGSAICNINNKSIPMITNTSFQGNITNLYNKNNSGSTIYNHNSQLIIYNTILLDNNAGGISNLENVEIYNSLIQGIGLDISKRNLDGVNTTPDMVFASVDPNSPDNLRLKAGSPAINRGNNTYNTTPTDLANNHRIANGTIDMGAYEYDSATLSAIEIAKDTTINIFPNPVDTTLNIIAEEQNTALLYNISGQLVKIFVVVKGKNTIEVAHLSRGLYLLKIGNSSVKIIKR